MSSAAAGRAPLRTSQRPCPKALDLGDLTLEIEDLIAASDHVLLYWHEVARVRDSDAVIESRTAMVFSLAAGAVTEVRGYLDRAAAREAVGLDG
jgi:ketosteroid isomerase-like protein